MIKVCENCAGQRHTDMGTTICSVCDGTGLQSITENSDKHRAFMGPLADWARSLEGRPVSTEKLAELVRICTTIEAPAAPRTGSGVSVEEIADLIMAEVFGATQSHREEHLEVAAKILALFAQAPRDGGETQGGWQPIETAPKDGTKFDAWAVHPATGSMGVRFADVQMRGDGSGFGVVVHRPKAHWEYLEDDGPPFPAWKLTHWRVTPTPPSGVETIRQDNTSGGGVMPKAAQHTIAGAIVLAILAVWVSKPDRAEPFCAERDMAVTERIFSACMAAQAGQAHSAYSCRQETERLSCKSWSRP